MLFVKSKYLLIYGFIFTVLLSQPSINLQAQSVYVPDGHWSYDFIERMETRGYITGVMNTTRPYSREEMAGYLVQLQEKMSGGLVLNKVEQQQFEFLRFEFGEEFGEITGANGHGYISRLQTIRERSFLGQIIPSFVYKNQRDFIHLKNEDFRIYADPVFSQSAVYANPDSIPGTESVYERSHGFRLRGRLGTHIGFYFDFRDTKEWGTRSYPRLFDITREGLGFVNGYGTHIWHDRTEAYLVFRLPYIQLIVGKHSNAWGPGYSGSLGLSNHATSYDQIKLQSKFWRIKFTYLWAFLRPFPVLLDDEDTARPKNLVAHRIDFDVARWLNLGVYESVVFADRRFELAYINPVNFYRSAEHHVADNDNVTMGFDFEILAIPDVKLYGELFLDDIFTAKIGSGWFGNKTGVLVGGYWVDGFTVPNLDFRIEYARIRPFVYTHEKELNRYTHFSTGLGHRIGPNADELLLQVQYRFSKNFVAAAHFTSGRHGANPDGENTGGDIDRSHIDRIGDTVAFLAGERERVNTFGLSLSYELFRNYYIGLEFSRSDAGNVELPSGIRGPVERNEVMMQFSINK